MVFWILSALLAAAVTYYVTRPLMRAAPGAASANASDLAVYKDQLAEIEGELQRGVISDAEAASARLEVSRRLLRTADHASVPAQVADAASLKPLYLLATAAIPLATLALYLAVGAPGLPSRPLKERIAVAPENATTTDLIAKVEARLREHPEDGKGWDVIAPVYASQGQFAEAAEAYSNATRLLGESVKRLLGFALAQIRAANGVVTPSSRKALERVLELEPKDFDARMYLALAKEQDGKTADAIAGYRAIAAEVPETAPLRKVLEERIAGLEQGGSAAPAQREAAGALDGLKDDEREMVEKMVAGLADRLKANGNDLPGWLKLAKAFKVMGREKDAREALGEARKNFSSEPPALEQIEAAVKELGLDAPAAPAAGEPTVTPPKSAAASGEPAAQEAKPIGEMVDGLAERLKRNGKDIDGWMLLVQSYKMLGRQQDAVKALAEGRQALASDKDALKKLDDLADWLGLKS